MTRILATFSDLCVLVPSTSALENTNSIDSLNYLECKTGFRCSVCRVSLQGF
ncbi:hypothetical protein M758_10G129400 [Ceratodon purpureus]|nr:hypothetical protein M758_10G129400 [Ceratodon purpureus]